MSNEEKVKGLVQWVASGIEVEVCVKCGFTGEVCKACHKLDGITSLAVQILSHKDEDGNPDLALIDRNREVPEVELPKFHKCGIITDEDLLEYARLTEVIARMTYIKAGTKFVIPLAKAIKEIEDGH